MTGSTGARAPTIDDVEARLAAFQSRLTNFGRELFGEEFVLHALAGEVEKINAAAATPDETTTATRTATTSATRMARKNKTDQQRTNAATTVLQRFLEDREELIQLRVMSKATTERMNERIGAAESRIKSLVSLLEESERRRRVDVSNAQAFLSELRKKLTSVERTQRRLLAMITRPDEDVDTMTKLLARQAEREFVETHTKTALAVSALEDGDGGELEDTLSKLSEELRCIEQSMALYTHEMK